MQSAAGQWSWVHEELLNLYYHSTLNWSRPNQLLNNKRTEAHKIIAVTSFGSNIN